MNQPQKIIAELVKISEHADAFRHGREDIFDDINLTEIHTLHWIGIIDHANVTKISNEMGMTRGAISKISKKLLGKELIESFQEPQNNKNVYFRLTAGGKKMFDVHKGLHERALREKLDIAQKYDADEQAVILRFLTDINCLMEAKLGCSVSADNDTP